MVGGMLGRGCAWQGGIRAGEMATKVGSTHPTGMHSCLFNKIMKFGYITSET